MLAVLIPASLYLCFCLSVILSLCTVDYELYVEHHSRPALVDSSVQ